MITPKHNFKNPKSESVKRAVEVMKLTDRFINLVDPEDYVNEYFNKNKESDEIININLELLEEVITLDKKQIIIYNNEIIKNE